MSRSSPTSTARLKISRFEPVDLGVLAHQVLRQLDVARGEGLLGLGHLRAGQATHPLDRIEDVLVLRRLVAGQRHELRDVHALIAHPLDAADHVQQRRDDPQIARHRRLARQQRQDALVHLQVAAVDPVIVGDDHPGQLDVLVGDRLERAVQLLDDEVEPIQRLRLERAQALVELMASLVHRQPYPNFPVT